MNPRILCALLLVVVACATVPPPAGNLQVKCNVPEAVVLIDDVLVGRADEWGPPGKAIRPGFHRVEIRHPGYFSYYEEIQLGDGGGAVVTASLHPLLD
jgi:PEGA domain